MLPKFLQLLNSLFNSYILVNVNHLLMADDYGITYINNVLKTAISNVQYFVLQNEATAIYGESETEYAFFNCKNSLKTFKISEGSKLQEIQQYAFYQCTALHTVDLRNCTLLITIGNSAFKECSALATIFLPESLTSLGDEVFVSSGIKTISLPEKTVHIGTRAFHITRQLRSITFAEQIKLTEIPTGCFQGSGIETIRIPKFVQTIGFATFEITYSLQNIEVQEGSEYFLSIDGVLYEKNTMVLVKYPSAKTENTFIMPDNVTELASIACDQSKFKSITFSSVIRVLGSYSFQGSSVESLYLPDTIISIGIQAFAGCNRLTSIKLSKNITSLPIGCFLNCAIESIEVPEGVIKLSRQCFMSCTHLLSVKLPNSIQTVEGGVFANCPEEINISFPDTSNFFISKDLLLINKEKTIAYQYLGSAKTFIIPATIRQLLESCFYFNDDVSEINFESSDTVTSIGAQCFSGCSNLVKIELPKSIKTIGDQCFRNCISLQSISFHSHLTSIAANAFASCRALSQVTFEDTDSDLQISNNCFDSCTNLTTIVLPEKLVSIGSSCFKGCSLLSSVKFPQTLVNCSVDAFRETGLVSCELPESPLFKLINARMFYSSSKLSSIKISSYVEEIGAQAFALTALKSIEIPDSV